MGEHRTAADAEEVRAASEVNEEWAAGEVDEGRHGDVKDLTGFFYMRVMSTLSTNIFGQGKDPPKVKESVKAIKAKKDYIWKESDVPKKDMQKIHGRNENYVKGFIHILRYTFYVLRFLAIIASYSDYFSSSQYLLSTACVYDSSSSQNAQ